jgi:hypothetical protein
VVEWLRRQDPPSDERVVLLTGGARSPRTRALNADRRVRRLAKPVGIETLLGVVLDVATSNQRLRPATSAAS